MQLEILLQLLFNSAAAASLILLVAYGFSMIFHTLKVFHIAHGAFIVLAPYIVISMSELLSVAGFHIALILFFLIAATSAIAVLVKKAVYQPIKMKC